MAPLHNLAAVDVPREVEKDVTRTHQRTELLGHVVALDAVLEVCDALGDFRGDAALVVDEVHDRDLRGRRNVAHEERQGALGHRTTAEDEDAAAKGHARNGGELHRGASLRRETVRSDRR